MKTAFPKRKIIRHFDGLVFRLSLTSKSKKELQRLGEYGAAKKRDMEHYRVVPYGDGYALFVN